MKKKQKKYYVLYEVVKNENGDIIDFINIYNFTSYTDAIKYIGCNNRDFYKMINNNVKDWSNLKLYKNQFIKLENDFFTD